MNSKKQLKGLTAEIKDVQRAEKVKKPQLVVYEHEEPDI